LKQKASRAEGFMDMLEMWSPEEGFTLMDMHQAHMLAISQVKPCHLLHL
jgi:hypothetical protein